MESIKTVLFVTFIQKALTHLAPGFVGICLRKVLEEIFDKKIQKEVLDHLVLLISKILGLAIIKDGGHFRLELLVYTFYKTFKVFRLQDILVLEQVDYSFIFMLYHIFIHKLLNLKIYLVQFFKADLCDSEL